MANLNSQYKPMGSIVVPDHEASCECVSVCKCASKNMPELNDSCKTTMGTTNTDEPHKHSICNDKISKTKNSSYSQSSKTKTSICIPDCDFWGSYVPPKDTTDTLEKSKRSSNFAACLFEFCVQEPRGKPFKPNEIHLDKPKPKYKFLNGHNINMLCYDIILEIYSKIFTAKQLYDHDFLHINNAVKYFRAKGLVTEELLFNLGKTFKENGYISSEKAIPDPKRVSVKGDDKTPEALKCFNYKGGKYYAKEHQDLVDNMNSLQEERKFSGALFANFMEPIERGDIILSKLNLVCCLSCPNVLNNLKHLNKEGLLIDPYLSKYMKLQKLTDNIIAEMISLQQPMKDSPQNMQNWIVTPSVHDTPYCDTCGLQSSWLKTFPKRGIHIRKANSYFNKHVWHNEIKDDLKPDSKCSI